MGSAEAQHTYSVVFLWRCGPIRVMHGHIHEVSRSHTTVGRTPLDEWSARRRDLYLAAQKTHKRQTCMPPAEFEPTISAGKRPQTHALDRAATGTGDTTWIPGQIHGVWACEWICSMWVSRQRWPQQLFFLPVIPHRALLVHKTHRILILNTTIMKWNDLRQRSQEYSTTGEN